jgi:hypothetical protein
MKEIKTFETFVSEKKSGKWIFDETENRKSLKPQIHTGRKETAEKSGELYSIKGKAKNKLEPSFHGLNKPGVKKFRKVNLSRDLMNLKEGENEHQNYMFFANMKNMHRMCQEILEMDHHKVDHILSDGHAWAVDHIATSKDDVEEVYNFLKSSCEDYKDQEKIMVPQVSKFQIKP